ncbi:MAG: ABC transporter substrate-binding protein [Alphaproteobacteria bacterium]|nr:ABC transporter substrate-binding protein [Alphaproteobacteria bacterium]
MIHFRSLIGVACASVALIAAMLATPTPAVALEKFTVKNSWSPYGLLSVIFLPLANGWFKEAGLDVEIDDGAGSMQAVTMMGGNRYDAGEGNLATMAIAREKELKVKAVLIVTPLSDFGLLAPTEKNIKSLKDVERLGLSLGFSAASMEGPLMDTFMRLGGVSSKTITLVNMDAGTKLANYMAGKVDTVMTSIPFTEPSLRDQKPSSAITYADVGLTVPGNGIMVHEDTIKAKPALLRKFVPVISRSLDHIFNKNGADEAIAATLKARPNAPLSVAIMKAQLTAYQNFVRSPAQQGKPMGWQAPSDWDNYLRTMRAAGLIKTDQKPGDYYTNEFFPGSS